MNSKIKAKKILLALFLANLNVPFSFSQFEDTTDEEGFVCEDQDENQELESENDEVDEDASDEEIQSPSSSSFITRNIKPIVAGSSIAAVALIFGLVQKKRMSSAVSYDYKKIKNLSELTTLLDSFTQGESHILKKTETGRYLPVELPSDEAAGFLGAATRAQRGEWLLQNIQDRCYEALKNTLATIPLRIEEIKVLPEKGDQKSQIESEVFEKVSDFITKVEAYGVMFGTEASHQTAYLKDLLEKIINPVLTFQLAIGVHDTTKSFVSLKTRTESSIKKLEASIPAPAPAPAPTDASKIHVVIKKNKFEPNNQADKASVDKFNDKLKSLTDDQALELVKKHFYFDNSWTGKAYYRNHYFSEKEVVFTSTVTKISDAQAKTILNYYKSLGS